MPRRPNYDDFDEYDDGYDDYDDYGDEEEDGEPHHSAGGVSGTNGSQDKAQGRGGVEGSRGANERNSGAQEFAYQPRGGEGEASGTEASSTPGEQGGAGTAEAARATVWRCPACTFDNPEAFLLCDICGAHKPAGMGGNSSGPFLPAAEPYGFDAPSPDDAVRAAQARGLSKPVKPTPAAATKSRGAQSTEVSKGKKTGGPHTKGDAAESGKGKGPSTSEQSEALHAMQGLRINGSGGAGVGVENEAGASSSSSSKREGTGGEASPAASSKPLSEYKPASWISEAGARAAQEKPTVHLVVIGHVDAGKSTLTGHLLHCMGLVSGKEMHKNKRESAEKGKGSFAFAWVLDEGSDERERGITMSLAVAHMETPHLHVKLLDAPGHRDFVPSMIPGAAQADAAILVVDASPGALEAGLEGTGAKGGRGQTWEHMQLARSSGVDQLIVAVNKMDVVDYSQDVFEEIKGKLSPYLKQSGYKDASVHFVPLSGLQGENLDKKASNPKLTTWYQGPCLLESIDHLSAPPRDLKHPLRLPISEVIPRSRALGAVAVAGKVEAGGLKPGLKVLVMPGGQVASVKAIETGGASAKEAVAGQSVDVGLTGVEPSAVFPGAVVCHPEFPVRECRRFQARILTLESPVPLLRGTQVVLHAHCAKEAAVVSLLEALLDPKSGKVLRERPRAIPSNSSALVEVTTERSIGLEMYSDVRPLGRVALRESGRTLAVGVVTNIF